MSDKEKNLALEHLSSINGNVTRVINSVISGSKSVSSQNSTVVAGVFGGFSGLSIAYLLTSFVGNISFSILGPLFTGLGIAAAVLIFRRSGTMEAETAAAQRQIALDENERISKAILARIQGLPSYAPEQMRQELWNDYRAVAADLVRLARPTASDRRPSASN